MPEETTTEPTVNNSGPGTIQLPPPVITTSEKYLHVLTALRDKLKEPAFFPYSDFSTEHQVSKRFIPACLMLTIITTIKVGNKIGYQWGTGHPGDPGAPITKQTADDVRRVVSFMVNGTSPRIERNVSTKGKATSIDETGRKAHKKAPGQQKKFVDRKDVVDEVRGSLFQRLCPDCAETMQQVIEMLKNR